MTCTIVTNGEELNLKCKNEHEAPYLKIKERLFEAIWGLYTEGYDKFYLNCEYGVPLWAAEIICALKMYNDIELHIVMPYEEQFTDWHNEYQERYFQAHLHADSVYMIGNRFSDDCYDKADCYMIDRSDLILVCGKKDVDLYSINYATAAGVNVRYLPDLLADLL